MTVPRPPDSPPSRRTARALREEAERRVSDSIHDDLAAPQTAPQAAPETLPMPIVAAAPDVALIAPPTRHDARASELLDAGITPIRHARPRRAARLGVAVGVAAFAALLVGASASMTAMMMDPPTSATPVASPTAPPLPSAEALPVPQVDESAATADICALPGVTDALAMGDDERAIAAAGGGEAFRRAVVTGEATCISLADPARTWVVINKTRPFSPLQFRPDPLVLPEGVRSLEGGQLREDAASALTALATAARKAGVGEIAMESGYRSYTTQRSSYGTQVTGRGVAGADLVSARPGYSEHQSGMAADLVACNGACGTLDDLAATPQGKWLTAHAWQFGWIVRYEKGRTGTTGYLPEPWHVRFIGPELARAYHQGAWHTLEDFFGLPPAPDYVR